MNTRKPQSSSVLDGLSSEQQKRLDDWLLEENRSYEEVRGLVASEFGVETSTASLCRYYQRWLAPRLVAEAAGETADPAVWEGLKTGCIEEASIGRARQLGFAALTQREPDVQAVARLFAMVNSVERVKLARERVALEQRRVAIAEKYQRSELRPMGDQILQQEIWKEVTTRMGQGETLAEIMTGWLEGRHGLEAAKMQAVRGEARRKGIQRAESRSQNPDEAKREGEVREADARRDQAVPAPAATPFERLAAQLKALQAERERQEDETEEMPAMREEIAALEQAEGQTQNASTEGEAAVERPRLEEMSFEQLAEHLRVLHERKQRRELAAAAAALRAVQEEMKHRATEIAEGGRRNGADAENAKADAEGAQPSEPKPESGQEDGEAAG